MRLYAIVSIKLNYVVIVVCLPPPYSPKLSHKRQDLWEKFIEHKMCFWFSIQAVTLVSLHLKKKHRVSQRRSKISIFTNEKISHYKTHLMRLCAIVFVQLSSSGWIMWSFWSVCLHHILPHYLINGTIYGKSFIHSLVFSLRGRAGRNHSPVMWPVWLWHTASWASSWG